MKAKEKRKLKDNLLISEKVLGYIEENKELVDTPMKKLNTMLFSFMVNYSKMAIASDDVPLLKISRYRKRPRVKKPRRAYRMSKRNLIKK